MLIPERKKLTKSFYALVYWVKGRNFVRLFYSLSDQNILLCQVRSSWLVVYQKNPPNESLIEGKILRTRLYSIDLSDSTILILLIIGVMATLMTRVKIMVSPPASR